jgi:hypothetical protein
VPGALKTFRPAIKLVSCGLGQFNPLVAVSSPIVLVHCPFNAMKTASLPAPSLIFFSDFHTLHQYSPHFLFPELSPDSIKIITDRFRTYF